MKNIFTLLLGIIVLVSCTKNKKQEVLLESLSSDVVYQLLFKPQQIILDNECLWVPSNRDSIFKVSHLSGDGYCHTFLDTTINFKQDGINRAVLIFGTYMMDWGEIQTCHGCVSLVSIALFEKSENNMWRLEKFTKNFGYGGGYGEMKGYRITELGDSYFLQESSFNMGMGYAGGAETYWHLPSLVRSICASYGDNSSGVSEESERESDRDSIRDISVDSKTKIELLKFESRFVNGKDQERLVSREDYALNDSCIFRPIKK